jgi:hypothetical protein
MMDRQVGFWETQENGAIQAASIGGTFQPVDG